MASLSVVLIVKNEAAIIEAALSGLDWADEIVVIDSGSTDDTQAIARKYTQQVYEYRDWLGYGVQRQRAQSHATGDWVLMLDADERVSSPLQQEITRVVQLNQQDRAYAVPILPWCFGRFIRHGGWYPAHKVRLYPRHQAHYGDDRVHEKLIFAEGMRIERLRGDLLHFTYRDLEHYLVKSARYAAEWAQQRQERGRTASIPQGVLHGMSCFLKMYVLRGGFLDGRQGFLLAVLSAHSTFVKYADLWVRQQPDYSAK
ncbi:MAG: glycosyltransferase family 2 protein [Gammaproteobacteria bacterium]